MMHLESLSLRNFRNYAQAHVTFSPGVNLILGDNGQGKTNLLEAIHLISTGRSFRTRHLSDLIRAGETFFYIEARFIKDGISQLLKIYYEDKVRKIQYNSTTYTHFTNLLGILPGVLLAPDDHALITGAPAERRRFLDLHIAQMDPLYIHHLARYFRALKQRNHLLKSRNESTLFAWEQTMAQAANYLIKRRNEAIAAIQIPIGAWMQQLSLNKDTLSVSYDSSFSIENSEIKSLLKQWEKNRPKEMQAGTTFLGPHRDDLLIEISQKEAKSFSSEGQKRCCAASIRLAEWQQLKSSIGVCPLMSIDDFGIQLDAERQGLLLQEMKRLGQVFLTCPKSIFPNSSDAECHTTYVSQGKIELPLSQSYVL